MIANLRSPGAMLRKNSSRLPARSVAWSDNPVTLPPGRTKLVTKPLSTGSFAIAKTMGITDVARFSTGTAAPVVTMASTLSRTNSVAISASRSGRPSSQRYSIATVRPSIQPSSRSRPPNAEVHGLHTDAFPPRIPIVGSRPGCCARAASGHTTAAPLITARNSRRLIESPLRLRVKSETSTALIRLGCELLQKLSQGCLLWINFCDAISRKARLLCPPKLPHLLFAPGLAFPACTLECPPEAVYLSGGRFVLRIGVFHGPACVLERLFEAVSRLLPDCTLSGDQRTREDQLPSAQ